MLPEQDHHFIHWHHTSFIYIATWQIWVWSLCCSWDQAISDRGFGHTWICRLLCWSILLYTYDFTCAWGLTNEYFPWCVLDSPTWTSKWSTPFTVSHMTDNSVTSVLHGSSENGLSNWSTQMSDLPTNSNISTTMCIDPAVYCDPSMSPTRVGLCSCSNNELIYRPIQMPEFSSNISTAPCLGAPVSSVPCEPSVLSVSRTKPVHMSLWCSFCGLWWVGW